MATPFAASKAFLFTPTSIPGCQIWLDAADSTSFNLSGNVITAWNDKSGTANNFSVSSGSPTYASRTVTFPSGAILNAARSISLTGNTYAYMVSRLTNASGIVMSLAFGDINSGFYGDFSIRYNNGVLLGTAALGGNGADFANGSYYVNGTFNPSFGSSVYAATTITSGQSIASGTTGVQLSSPFFNRFFVGTMNEVLLYSSPPTTVQRQQVEGYLAWKWGLQGTLPSDHPYKTTPVYSVAYLPFPTTVVPSVATVVSPKNVRNSSVFLPTQISGCQLWLDATDVNGTGRNPANGTSISRWADKSGVGNTVTQGTVSNQPTIAIVGALNYVNFTASNTTFLSNTSMTIDYRTSQIFLVFQRKTIQANNGVFCPLTTANTNGDWQNTNEFIITTVTEVASAGSGSNDNQSNNLNLTTYQFVINNNSLTTFRDFGASSVITRNMGLTTSPTSLVLGRRRDGTSLLPSDIYFGEAIVYNRLLTVSENQQLQGYLAWKWGLVNNLPNGHPYKTPPIARFPYAVRIGGQAKWQPTQVSGCQLWLDAADASTFTLSGSTVTQWRDKSGNGANATGSGTPTLTQSIQNRLPAIYFNGTSYFTGALTNTTNQHSFFSVFRYDTGAPQYARLASFGVNGQFDYNNNAYYNLSYNTGTLAITRSPTETQVTLASPAQNAFHQASILFTGTLGLYYTDGGTNTNSAAWSANFNYSQYRLGSDQIPFVPQEMIGYIAEVIVYATAITTAQRQQVEGYLAWKWALVGNLPVNHPYKLVPPST
jgi:hypothetical protein